MRLGELIQVENFADVFFIESLGRIWVRVGYGNSFHFRN